MIEDTYFIKQEALEEKYFVSVFTRTIGDINISKCWYKYITDTCLIPYIDPSIQSNGTKKGIN